MSMEAMKLALEALEECRRDPRLKYEHSVYDKTITALRIAIAAAERQEAWEPSDTSYRPGGLPQDFIGHEFEKQEPVARNTIEFRSACNAWVMRITADRRIEVNEDVEVTEAAQKVLDAMQHLLTPAAQWVGFTEDEINEWDYDTRDLVMDIEKLLREKNT